MKWITIAILSIALTISGLGCSIGGRPEYCDDVDALEGQILTTTAQLYSGGIGEALDASYQLVGLLPKLEALDTHASPISAELNDRISARGELWYLGAEGLTLLRETINERWPKCN